MEEKEPYGCKSRLQEIVPSTRFGQALASLFYLKRHKKRDPYGRAPVVSRLRAPTTFQTSLFSSNPIPSEVLTPMQPSPPPPPMQVSSLE